MHTNQNADDRPFFLCSSFVFIRVHSWITLFIPHRPGGRASDSEIYHPLFRHITAAIQAGVNQQQADRQDKSEDRHTRGSAAYAFHRLNQMCPI
jgi:hypothetical protein